HRPRHRYDDRRLSLAQYRPGLGVSRCERQEDGAVAGRGTTTAGTGILLRSEDKLVRSLRLGARPGCDALAGRIHPDTIAAPDKFIQPHARNKSREVPQTPPRRP